MWRGTTWEVWLDCTVAGLRVGSTFVGTDGLLWRTEGFGRKDEVAHVYISVPPRDLDGSDDLVRRVWLGGWVVADDCHRACGRRGRADGGDLPQSAEWKGLR